MSVLTAVYNESDLSRVTLTASAIASGVDTVLFERSIDGVTWSTVRGGAAVPVVAGGAVLWDAEFAASVTNTYRATYMDSDLPTFVGQGALATGNNTDVTPVPPTGKTTGDTMLLFAAIQNSGTGTPPASIPGWTLIAAYGPMAVYSRRYVLGDTGPTVSFVGGATGASTSAFIAVWRNMNDSAEALTGLINASQQNIPVSFLTLAAARRTVVSVAWKQNGAATAGSTLSPGFTTTSTLANALGNGQSLFYSYRPADNTVPALSAQTLTVTGGVAAISRSLIMSFAPAVFQSQQTATVTPVPTQVWIKFPSFPGQNTPVTVTDWGDVVRPSRTSLIDVVNRTNPIAITDVMGSRETTITLRCATPQAGEDLDGRLAGGLPMFLQAPDSSVDSVLTMYCVTTGLTRRRPAARSQTRYFDLPIKETSAPASTIAGVTFTWQDVLNTYPTWADVIAANATWLDLINKVSTASMVVP
jgi:hypothetical protein